MARPVEPGDPIRASSAAVLWRWARRRPGAGRRRSPAIAITLGLATTILCLIGEAWIFTTILDVVPDPSIDPDQVRRIVDIGKLIGAATIAGLTARLVIDRLIAWHSPLRAAGEVVALFVLLFVGAHRALVYVSDLIVDSLDQATARRAAAIAYYREGVKHGEIVDLDLPAATGDPSPIRRLELVNLAVGVADVSPDGYAARAIAELSTSTRRELRQVDRQVYAARMLARLESRNAINEIEIRYAGAIREIDGRARAERAEALQTIGSPESLDRLYAGYEATALGVAAAWESYRKAAAELPVEEGCASCRQDFEHLTGFAWAERPQSIGEFVGRLLKAEPAEPALARLKQSLGEAERQPVPSPDGSQTLLTLAEGLGFQPMSREEFRVKVDVARQIDARIAEESGRLKQRAELEREEALARVSEAEDRVVLDVERRADAGRLAIRDYARRVQEPDRSQSGIDRDLIAAAVLPPFALAVASLGMVGNSGMAALLVLALVLWWLGAERSCRVARILAGIVPPVVIVVALMSSNPSPAAFGERFVRAVETTSSIGEWTLTMDLGPARPSLSWPAVWRRTIDIETRLALLLI